MTKSTITRERLEELASGQSNFNLRIATHEESQELARMVLATLDSEPVVQCPYPCGWDALNKLAIQDAAFVALALVAGEPATESIRSAVISNNDRLLKVISFCRDVMPQAGNSPVIGIDPASGPDRSVEVRYVAPPGYVMVPKDLLSELRDWAHPEIEKYCEMWEGRRDSEFPVLRKVIADADSLLATSPQPQKAPQNIPEIIPGWIPVSERMPDCWCRTCRPVDINDMRFVVCPDCGNKRCPRANDHRNACTGSNEPGQEGSAYPSAHQEVK